MVTIKDVAKESGVSISTVSNVINNVDNVSEETRKKVFQAIEKLNYVPNVNARYLRMPKKNTLGLFLSSIQGDFYKTLVQAVHFQCKLAGYMLNIYISNENTSEEIYDMVISSGVEGAIIMNENLEDTYMERLKRMHMPIVFIDRDTQDTNISSVMIDNYLGAEMAMEYLIMQGHRRIGYLHGIKNVDDQGRFQAFLDVMEKYRLPVDKKHILTAYFEEAIAFSEIRQLLMKGVEMPDAFFCANDEMACGCIRALASFGISVPEMVSVVGFDDAAMATYYTPKLTTVHSPVQELGTQSTQELIRLIKEGSSPGTSIKLPPSMVIRESCKLKL